MITTTGVEFVIVNPEISCIRMGSGPALFGLARFYWNYKLRSRNLTQTVGQLFVQLHVRLTLSHGNSSDTKVFSESIQ